MKSDTVYGGPLYKIFVNLWLQILRRFLLIVGSRDFRRTNNKLIRSITDLSSKLVVAAMLTTISTSLHISSSMLESLTPMFSCVMSPATGVTLLDRCVYKSEPNRSFKTLNSSFAKICKYIYTIIHTSFR